MLGPQYGTVLPKSNQTLAGKLITLDFLTSWRDKRLLFAIVVVCLLLIKKIYILSLVLPFLAAGLTVYMICPYGVPFHIISEP